MYIIENADYLAFMSKAGTCWTTCSKSDQTAYTTTEFPATCQWYEAHKSDKCEVAASKENSSYKFQATGIVGLMALGVAALLY